MLSVLLVALEDFELSSEKLRNCTSTRLELFYRIRSASSRS